MKAIVLWEPWASAMALGLKRLETRSWPTSHRGDIVICAAKRPLDGIGLELAMHYMPKLVATDAHTYGRALAVVEIDDCRRTESIIPQTVQELQFGDYTPGRFAWFTRNLRPIPNPPAVTGRQGIFDLPPEVAAEIAAQLKFE